MYVLRFPNCVMKKPSGKFSGPLELEPASLAINANYGQMLSMARRFPEAQSAIGPHARDGAKLSYHSRPPARMVRNPWKIREARQTGISNFCRNSAKLNRSLGKRNTGVEFWKLRASGQKSPGKHLLEREFQASASAQLGDRENALMWLEKSAANQDDLLPLFHPFSTPQSSPRRSEIRCVVAQNESCAVTRQ